MDAIALGCLTAMALQGRRLQRGAVYGCGLLGAALLTFCLGFSLQAYKWGWGRNGLFMTVLAIGTCFALAAAATSGWKAPRVFAPITALGRLSYEVYLTHFFFVLAFFTLFAAAGKPMWAVPLLFTGVLTAAGFFAWGTSRLLTEPLNRWMRGRAGLGPRVTRAALAVSE